MGGGGGLRGSHQSVKQFESDQAQHLGLGEGWGWNGGMEIEWGKEVN